jgi:hypothetical protein
MRVPSSSSSRSKAGYHQNGLHFAIARWGLRTDSDWLNLNALLDVRVGRVIRVLALQDLLAAEGVDEGGAT